MIDTMANGYSSEGTQRELSNEYPNDRVKKIFMILFVLVHWKKVTSALKELMPYTLQERMFYWINIHTNEFCLSKYTKKLLIVYSFGWLSIWSPKILNGIINILVLTCTFCHFTTSIRLSPISDDRFCLYSLPYMTVLKLYNINA